MKALSHLALALLLAITPDLHAAVPTGKTQQLTAPDQVPEGLAKSDWASIRAAYEAGRHAFQTVEGGWQARNPGQQWLTRFDGRGFVAEPADGGWQWGLELQSYGFPGSERAIGGVPAVQVKGQRLTYVWDVAVQEWFTNDARGLEHGFTVRERPEEIRNTKSEVRNPLSFTLSVRGCLHSAITTDGQGVEFRDAAGVAVLHYAGLKVWDADGKTLSAHFAAVDAGVRLLVEERGARYPITIDPIAQQAYLKASNTGASDYFGYAVAVSGDTVVVGAQVEDGSGVGVNPPSDELASGAGAAYVFVRNGTSWSQQAYLKASNTGAGDQFGISVAVSGDTVVVGAAAEDGSGTGVNPPSDELASGAGAAYVFVRNGTSWSQQAYLKASNTGTDDFFGISVAVSGDTVVVGAYNEAGSGTGVNPADNNGATDAGAAYVFVRSGTSWSQQAYLKASNTGTGDYFGYAVAVSGDTVVVGASNEAGSGVGVNPPSDEGAAYAGAAYVFVRSGTSWSQQAYLKASNTGTDDQFGTSVAVSGDTVIVGALGEAGSGTGVNPPSDELANQSGAAYVFVRNGTSWSQQAYLKASNTGTDDNFGISVAVSGDTVIVGALGEAGSGTGVNPPSDELANQSGAAYVFVRSGTSWSQQAYLKASNTGTGDYFGVSVSVSGDTVVVGAFAEAGSGTGVNPADNNGASVAGAAYVFTGLGLPVTAPEIVVEQSAVNIADGGFLDFGNVGIGSGSVAKAFTIKNIGTGALTGLTISKDGRDQALFTVTTMPVAPVASNGSTSFTVQVATTTLGLKTAVLHIASNDIDEAIFDITLIATGVSAVLPVVTTAAANGITFNGATFNGTANAKGSDRTVTFDYGTTTSYGGSVVAVPASISGTIVTSVNASVTNLLPHTKYNFHARAVGPLGSASGTNLTFTTLNHAPVATGETALALPSAKVAIHVLANDSDPDSDVLSIYSFTQPGAAVGTVAKMGTDLVFTPSATFTGGSFTYIANDAFGGRSNAATVTLSLAACTLGADVTIPSDSPPYDLTVTATAPWTVIESLSWLTFVAPAPGDMVVHFVPSPNPALTSRTGTVKIGGKTHTVTQSGVAAVPVLSTPSPIPNAAISASYDLAIPTQNGPVTYTATGLPTGLTLSNVTGHITGMPTVAGTSTITVLAKNAKGASNPVSFGITVLPFPASMPGNYSATVEDSEPLTAQLGGLMTMSVTSAGVVTGTLKLGAGSYPFIGRLNTAVNALAPDPVHAALKVAVARAGKPSVVLTVNMNTSSTDLIAGDVTLPGTTPATASLTGSRHVWNAVSNAASAYNGSFTAALQPHDSTVTTVPQGDGFLTFTISTAGAVIWSGQLADGSVIAPVSATLWANGDLPLFSLLYTSKGSLNQRLSIAPTARTVTGSPHWFKEPQAASVRAYAAGFAPTSLQVAGAEYVPPVAGETLLNIVTPPGTAHIAFSDGGINSVFQFSDLDQVFTVSATPVATFNTTPAVNPALVKLTKIDVVKGTFTGSMTIKDTNPFNGALPQVSRVVNFNGVLLPTASMGTGYLLLPGITGPPANVTTSPMTSGLVRITP